MDELESSDGFPEMSKSDIVSEFWVNYKETGLETAYATFQARVGDDEELIRSLIPELVSVARDRGIDLIAFLQEWEVYMEKVNGAKAESSGS